MRKCLVISAINFSEGGALTVLRDCLASATISLSSDWNIIALVHDQKLIDQPRVQFINIHIQNVHGFCVYITSGLVS
jgi:hypothetical protein